MRLVSDSKMSKRVVYLLLAFIAWGAISGYLIYRYRLTGTPLNLRTLFPVVASGIIIFVPIYKKYFRDNNSSDGSHRR